MLTVLVYIVEKLSHSLFSMMFLSGLIATVFTLVGLWFSYTYNLTSGASIILVSAASLGAFLLLYRGK